MLRLAFVSWVGLLLVGCATTAPTLQWTNTHGEYRVMDVDSRIRMLGGPPGLAGWRMSSGGDRVMSQNALMKRKAYPLEFRARQYPDDWLQQYEVLELHLRREVSANGQVADLSIQLCGQSLTIPSSAWESASAEWVVRADLAALREQAPRGCEPAFVYQIELVPDDDPVEVLLSDIRIRFLPAAGERLSQTSP